MVRYVPHKLTRTQDSGIGESRRTRRRSAAEHDVLERLLATTTAVGHGDQGSLYLGVVTFELRVQAGNMLRRRTLRAARRPGEAGNGI